MSFLSENQKEDMGLAFILNNLNSDSPYGKEALKTMGFYKRSEKAALMEELYNIGQIYAALGKGHVDSVRRALMRFKYIVNSLRKCENSYLSEIELFEIKSFLLALSKLSEAFIALNAGAKLKNISFINLEEALDILDPDKKRMIGFHISENYSETLRKIRQEKDDIERKIHETTIAEEKDRLKLNRLEIVKREQDEELVIKKDLCLKLRPYLDNFHFNIENIARLDVVIQKAVLAKAYGGVCPKVGCETLTLKNVFNPMVCSALEKENKTFTPVCVELEKGVTILTGANMGGKSVSIKTIALNIMLCHLGFFIFAEEGEIPLFDGIYLVSEDMQSINKGLSSFGAEIVKFNEVVEAQKNGFVFIALDEFARGTNPSEGSAIVKGVAKYLNNSQSISIISTHYDNINDGNYAHYQVSGFKEEDFENMQGKMSVNGENGLDLIAKFMDYSLVKIKESNYSPRDALNICRFLALDQEILSIIEKKYK